MICLRNIYKNIGENTILKNINLDIEKGEFVAIIGQSGSGKTSLLNIIGTLDSPSSGNYLLDGYEVTKLNNDEKARLRREKIGFIFQRYNLLNLFNSSENVSLPAIYAGKNVQERRQRSKELLSDLGLEHKLYSKPNELSGGQQQRVSIARALMNGGELILADEPTGALDSKSGIMVLEILQKLNKQGHTIVLVTHDPKIAQQAKRVIEIKDGEILSDTKEKNIVNSQEIISKMMTKEKKTLSLLKNQAFECFKIAYSSIIAHKLRSILTMLGIIIGIASVVCVVALGLGSQAKVLQSISDLGTSSIEIFPGKGFGDLRSGKTRLNFSDLKTLKSLNFLEAVDAYTSSSGVATYSNISLNAKAEGVGVNNFAIDGLKIDTGRILSEDEVQHSSNVVVLDFNAKKNLFPELNNEDVLGRVVIFDSQPFKIIGILKKDQNKIFDDNVVRLYIPYTTLMNKITGDKKLREIIVKVKDDMDSTLAENAIIRVLTLKRGQKDFFTFNSDTFRKTFTANKRTTTILTICVAVIALVVGGIGVMNIMLVSVSERTREIGIRMAIGARREDIMMQFLIEAIMICTIGAILGVVLSVFVIFAFNHLSTDFPMILNAYSIFLGLLSSILIGVIFGFFPAKNAANLNPIHALSKE
ncbi:ABC transporter permease [Campylobacter sp. LH-2024]|uniref:ABC transporter permease n=1 Tax=Campylobacter molothri TaxID=1032242 RepID=A0ACC5W2K0_9BACT|nr:ABC transporter permease [Campylobacter sp. RM10542]MBZ7929531.1 ABC transporter permease [Campylobacter sp. W0067]MBZ7933086.1 ABC transporter permease [Campylobacter sp. RM10543]MBZ7940694.1 ABC transporter permease [Campylobacter sp. W0047]MBZ7947890.1 ABC transporter permease [Campylobacter sp. RM9929]MBZ7950628.1 ABC transporter permease [Campylobacter sp. W0046]MBZ7958608.1 ABC transporter permease [Campylobacter sp. RM9760]MBZ7960162.1 ABC transporter permease [Campylobacter sp. RM